MKNCDDVLVTIITPSFNQGKYIERTILSVLGQNYRNIEYWIIDGGSTDNTIEILRKYADRLSWVSEPDRGQSDALNKGFKRAKGTILGWLNADDTYNPGTIHQVVAVMQENPEVGMVYSHCNVIDANDNLIFCQEAPQFSLKREVLDHNLPQPSAFFRSSVMEAVNYLDPDLHYVMDWDLFLRIGAKFIVRQVNSVWANFREADGTKTRSNPEKFWDEIIGVFEHFFSMIELPTDVRELKVQALARAYWVSGVIRQTYSDSDSNRLGLQRCRAALEYYPLLERDYKFASSQIVDWAVRTRMPFFRRKVLINSILQGLQLSDKQRQEFSRRITGLMYASSALMQGDKRFSLPLLTPEKTIDLALSAIKLDPFWALNRGLMSILARNIFREGLYKLQKWKIHS